jgi:hypothetical protein
MVKKILTIEKVADNHLSIHIKLSSLHRKLMDQTRKKNSGKKQQRIDRHDGPFRYIGYSGKYDC